MVNPLADVKTWLPVVTTTFTAPVAAVGLTVTLAVRLVELDTVTEFTVTPEEKATVVVPCTKLVTTPVIATFRVCACCPVLGLKPEIAGVAIVNPFVSDATSPIVVIVTVCAPGLAPELIVI
jgi:hypothetical protein